MKLKFALVNDANNYRLQETRIPNAECEVKSLVFYNNMLTTISVLAMEIRKIKAFLIIDNTVPHTTS